MHQKDSLLHPGGPQTLCALLKTFIPRRSSQTGVVSVLEHVFNQTTSAVCACI